MGHFNPEKLSVEYREGITVTNPFIPRRYTLTHSDVTGELFLTIGLTFAFEKINPMRDEVFGEWGLKRENPCYSVYLHVDGPSGQGTAKRYAIFRRELPLALEAIRFGDQCFFNAYPELNFSPIMIHFISNNPQFNIVENWGPFAKYT